MKEQPDKQSVGTALEAYAATAIPNRLDLWPIISERLQSRPRTVRAEERYRSRQRWALGRPAVAVGAAILLTAVLLLAGLPPAQHQGASAQGVLNDLAEVAAIQVQLEPQQPVDLTGAKNAYRYTRSEGAHLVMMEGRNGRPVVALVPRSRELWVAPDGSGRIRETFDGPIFLAECDRAHWQASGSPSFDHAINQDFGPGGLHYEDFASLPTDPEALAVAIRAQAEHADPPVDAGMFVIVGDLLRQPGAPPELRSALYKVAAQIPGVELVGEVTDHAGRSGIAVAMRTEFGGAAERFTLIFDPTTSALLAEERVLLEPADWTGANPPAIIGYETYLESGTVTRLP
ncbi:MAG: CU044_5270 family protein [Anaerolineae bacterium]|nr:CU044_5270 family protein [Anaerolineae bacterium]